MAKDGFDLVEGDTSVVGDEKRGLGVAAESAVGGEVERVVVFVLEFTLESAEGEVCIEEAGALGKGLDVGGFLGDLGQGAEGVVGGGEAEDEGTLGGGRTVGAVVTGVGEVEAEGGGDRFVFDKEFFAIGQCAHGNIPQNAVVDEDEGFDLGVFECGGDRANQEIVGAGGFGTVAFGGDIFKRIAEALHLGLELAFGYCNPMELERSGGGLGQQQGFGFEDNGVDGEGARFERGEGGCGGAARLKQLSREGFLKNLDAVVAIEVLQLGELEAFEGVYCFCQVGLGGCRDQQSNEFAV